MATPKRGGALKCSPLGVVAGDREALSKLIQATIARYEGLDLHKTYMHVPLLRSDLIAEAVSLGYEVEGVLRQPYVPGSDMVALGRQLK